MRLNDWQSSSDIVTSSDDFASACLYGFEDNSNPSSTSWGDLREPATTSNNTLENIASTDATLNGGTKTTKKGKGGGTRNKSVKSSYKHVPHREKPPHLVARRNARERRRVQAVNTAFARLRKCVPLENRNKRLSKVKTLQRAIEYINNLQDLLDDYEAITPTCVTSLSTGLTSSNPQQVNSSFVHLTSTTPPSGLAVDRISTCNILNKNFAETHGIHGNVGVALHESFDDFADQASVVNKENEVHQRWINLENSVSDNFGSSFMPSFYEDFGAVGGALHA